MYIYKDIYTHTHTHIKSRLYTQLLQLNNKKDKQPNKKLGKTYE